MWLDEARVWHPRKMDKWGFDWLFDSGVWPVSGTLRWSLHLRHCARWGFLGPPDVVRGTLVWKGWFGRPTDILSSPIKIIIVTVTLGYDTDWLRDLDLERIHKWEHLILGHLIHGILDPWFRWYLESQITWKVATLVHGRLDIFYTWSLDYRITWTLGYCDYLNMWHTILNNLARWWSR